MASKGREKIKLVSQGKTKAGKPTGTFYTTSKNKKAGGGTQTKLERKKYDARAYNVATGKSGMHVVFREGKIDK